MTDINNHIFSNVFISHKALKTAFLRKNSLEPTRPCLEILLCARQIEEQGGGYWKVGQLRRLLVENKLPCHLNSCYQAVKILQAHRFIEPVTPGRKWFTPQVWHLTSKGASALYEFEDMCRQKAK